MIGGIHPMFMGGARRCLRVTSGGRAEADGRDGGSDVGETRGVVAAGAADEANARAVFWATMRQLSTFSS
jgi:hypothetical protein